MIAEGVSKKYHNLEPPDKDYPYINDVITQQPTTSLMKKKKLLIEETLALKRRKSLGIKDYKSDQSYNMMKPSTAMYRFKIWWFGYMAAVNCQRIVRGYFGMLFFLYVFLCVGYYLFSMCVLENERKKRKKMFNIYLCICVLCVCFFKFLPFFSS